jgi:pilus assembly protein TadC
MLLTYPGRMTYSLKTFGLVLASLAGVLLLIAVVRVAPFLAFLVACVLVPFWVARRRHRRRQG